jgi:hypothetical protein
VHSCDELLESKTKIRSCFSWHENKTFIENGLKDLWCCIAPYQLIALLNLGAEVNQQITNTITINKT